MIFGKANKNNYNDNTSGVVTLLEIMSKLDADKRENVAFVFFDNEEKGLIGSMYFKKTYKKALDEKLFINFDCVGDGDNIMFVTSKAVRNSTYQEELETINCGDASKNILFIGSNKAIYPSDQINFKNSVGVCALNKKPLIGYYLSRIHTSKDTILDYSNIELLKDFSISLVNNNYKG